MTAPGDSSPERNRQRGSIAIILVAALGLLFSLAALAVDAGFLYTRQRGLQAIADVSALAGGESLSTAIASARAMATKNGYTNGVGGNVVTVTSPVAGNANQVQVTITSTQSFYFARAIHFNSKTMTVSAIAVAPPSLPALWAGGGCGSGTGLQLGGGVYTITGDIQSNGPLNDYTSGGDVDNGKITNSSSCTPGPNWRGTATGGISQAAATTDPMGYNILTDFPTCTSGNLTTTVASYNVPSTGGTVAAGVYCAKGNLNLSTGSAINAVGVTLLATGNITIGSGSITNMTPAAGAHNIIAFSGSANSCSASGGPAINVGNTNAGLNGSFYAPHGCINMGGPNFTINGSLIGNEVNISGPGWTINSSGGGGGGNVTLYQ
jgi:putative Flp pilus-assembly TadE/G-like protein